MVHLRRNCSDDSTYLEQAKVLGKRFIMKGYNEDFIEEKIKEVYRIPRNTLIQDKEKETSKFCAIPLIFNYNTQHKEVEQIITKHWALLKADKHLNTILPDRPYFVYRKAPTLRDKIAKNIMDPPKRSNELSFFQGKGFFSL